MATSLTLPEYGSSYYASFHLKGLELEECKLMDSLHKEIKNWKIFNIYLCSRGMLKLHGIAHYIQY